MWGFRSKLEIYGHIKKNYSMVLKHGLFIGKRNIQVMGMKVLRGITRIAKKK
jgi:hypothetical protein